MEKQEKTANVRVGVGYTITAEDENVFKMITETIDNFCEDEKIPARIGRTTKGLNAWEFSVAKVVCAKFPTMAKFKPVKLP